jgi:hypothetical protein
VLDKVSFRSRQFFMGDGTKHTAQSYQPSKRLCVLRAQLLISSFFHLPFCHFAETGTVIVLSSNKMNAPIHFLKDMAKPILGLFGGI